MRNLKKRVPTAISALALSAMVVVLLGIWFIWFNSSSESAIATDTTGTTTPVTINATTTLPSNTAVVEVKQTASINSIIASLGGESIFASYLSSTGVATTLSGKGPYTIFVPSNAAFAALSPGTISNLSAAEKKRLVQYHIVVGRALDIDAVSSGAIQALSKDALNFNVNISTGVAQVNSSFVIHEYKASNGIVYVITGVLFPPLKS